MRDLLTRERFTDLMREIARAAPRRGEFQVYFVGGGTAVLSGWRESSIDADLFAPNEAVFCDIQKIKERLNINVEFVRPEHFVPALPGSDDRHVFVDTIGRVTYYHYDPYAQVFSKIVRGFERDIQDVQHFVEAGLVDPKELLQLVRRVPDAIYAKYPSLSRKDVVTAVQDFVDRFA